MEEIWKTVPGFNGYSVSNKGNVRGKMGKLLAIHNRRVILCNNGTCKGICVIRLMYASFNNLDLSSLKGLVVTGDSLNNIKVFDKYAYLDEMRKKRMLKFVNEQDVDRYYTDTLKDIRLIMDAQSTGNMQDVIMEINSKREDVVKFILHFKFSSNSDTIEEAWLHARETCIIYIVKKSYAVTNITSILKAIARNYFMSLRKEKKKLVDYDDNRYSQSSYMY